MFFVFGNDGGFVLSFTCTCSTCVQVYIVLLFGVDAGMQFGLDVGMPFTPK